MNPTDFETTGGENYQTTNAAKGIPTEFDYTDAQVIQIPVKFSGAEYLLVEANGADAAEFRNHVTKNQLRDDEGNVTGMRNSGDLQLKLLGLCLFTVGEDGKPGKRVEMVTIRKWPERVVKELFKTAMKISELIDDDDEDEQAKNE